MNVGQAPVTTLNDGASRPLLPLGRHGIAFTFSPLQ